MDKRNTQKTFNTTSVIAIVLSVIAIFLAWFSYAQVREVTNGSMMEDFDQTRRTIGQDIAKFRAYNQLESIRSNLIQNREYNAQDDLHNVREILTNAYENAQGDARQQMQSFNQHLDRIEDYIRNNRTQEAIHSIDELLRAIDDNDDENRNN